MAQKKSFLPVLLLILLLLVGAGGYYYWSQMQAQQAPTPAAQADLDDVDDVADAAPLPQIDVDAALSDRILGDANAPMRISEHSSLTCGHCGAFHKHTFKPFKEKWIDGGKAYLVFSDFPLNAPALHAAMAARCLPDTTRYFEFVQMLFENQAQWAGETTYKDYLKGKAAEYGLDGPHFEACIANEALQKGIVDRVRANQQQFNISSTPSFVINNQVTVAGNRDFETFDREITEAYDSFVNSDNSEEPPLEPQP